MPYSGVISNTNHYRNTHFQPSNDYLGMSWHGFGDHRSHIRQYSVWVTDLNTNETVAIDSNTRIRNCIIFKNITLIQNHTYFASVQAWDGMHMEAVYFLHSR